MVSDGTPNNTFGNQGFRDERFIILCSFFFIGDSTTENSNFIISQSKSKKTNNIFIAIQM
jgi:hypothetical protein